jgi:hypothetical protein
LALVMTWNCGIAFAEDEEDLPWDTRILRQFMKDLGLQRDGPPIEFRERAPLVVPPSRTLPPPQDERTVTTSPAWPKDPDVQKRRQATTSNKKRLERTSTEVMEAEARPLPRSELDKGRIPPGTQPTTGSPSPEESARPMQPKELGAKSIFSGMFSSFSNKGETGAFTGEPVRESLTAPPPGYQTPSPSQPYGVGATVDKPQVTKPEDRITGYER